MAIRNTPYESEKIEQLAMGCPKLKIRLEKRGETYMLAGGEGGGIQIQVARRSLAEAIRIYRAEYGRLASAGLLDQAAKAERV